MRAKEFITEYEDNIVQFKRPHPMDTRSDDEKYDDAVRDQQAKNWKYDPLDDDDKDDLRSDIGEIPCPYCDDVWCNIDCEKAQAGDNMSSDPELEDLLKKAGMFDPTVDEGNAKNANALVGSGLGGNTHKPNKDSKYLKSVRTPTTNYPVDRKKYNHGAKPGANPGFVGG